MKLANVSCTVSVCLVVIASALQTYAQGSVSGRVVNMQFEPLRQVEVVAETTMGPANGRTDRDGRFRIEVLGVVSSLRVAGQNIKKNEFPVSGETQLDAILLKVEYIVPPIVETVTITDDSLTPNIEVRNEPLYKETLFTRDDQLIQTLNAGINAGQHEGGGKSLEIRRYGFNTDHGGVNGGLKIVVDNIQQNFGTQGHGQGYVGSLKSLSPELVEGVSIINGPFSAAYGDFSGLGVVQISQKESLDSVFTARLQGGSFNSFRGFFAYSPSWKNIDAFIAYEPSYTDGPFISPLKYRRDNVTANFGSKVGEGGTLGVKFNFGRNNFFSSGQIPLDLVATGELDRFGFIDPENGGRVKQGTLTGYFRKQFDSGSTLKVDAFVGRSLYDLFSNFTFFAADPIYGDQIQQHDSRLQEGVNFQFLKPYRIFSTAAVVTVGANVHLNQINFALYPTVGRAPNRKFLPGNVDNPNVLLTSARAKVNNYAGYVQNEANFFGGHLRVDAGVRFDVFTYGVNGFELSDVRTDLVGQETDAKVQPKLSLAWSPFAKLPVSFYANYGRGISSQDARGVVREPSSPKISTTDFYQGGTSFNQRHVSLVFSSFLIDRSAEQVYIPDDGSIELAGPTRSYGVEARASVRLNRYLNFNGGLTNVFNSFFRNEFASDGHRLVVDSAPRFVSNAGIVLNGLRGFTASLNWRHVSNYRLDGEEPTLRASGNDVVDFAVAKRLRNWIDLNLSIDNLFNKRFFEMQNFFESRTCTSCDPVERIHATPGYPFTVNAGITFHLGAKN